MQKSQSLPEEVPEWKLQFPVATCYPSTSRVCVLLGSSIIPVAWYQRLSAYVCVLSIYRRVAPSSQTAKNILSALMASRALVLSAAQRMVTMLSLIVAGLLTKTSN